MSDLSLKDVMRTFPQGVSVVTAEGDDQSSQGTHTVFFGEVDQIALGASSDAATPLVFCSRAYWGLGETVHER